MWDLHAVSGSGASGSLGALSTILLGGDRATLSGVPTHPSATLAYHGVMATIADTLAAYQLLNNDLDNPRLGFNATYGTSSTRGITAFKFPVLASQLQRLQSLNQNTAGSASMAFTIDYYKPSGDVSVPAGSLNLTNVFGDSNVFAQVTSVSYKEKAYVPSITLETGRYAILGAEVTGLTNYGLVRFYHNDFNGFYPGFPVVDQSTTAASRAVDPGLVNLFPNGMQFLAMGECPTFRVTADGSGLTFAAAAITTDTPTINVYLQKVSS